MKEFIPRLRTDIEFIPASYQGERAIFVKDSLGLIEKPVLLKSDVMEFLSLIDGERDIRDFQLELMRRKGGVFISLEEIKKMLSELDSAFLLDSEHYHQEKERMITQYSLLEVRVASHAGNAYPAEPGELGTYLDSFFLEKKSSQLNEKEVFALISPHIDLNAGKKVYARAYQEIENSTPRRIIVLGTGHSIQEPLLSLTEKDFETPLGLVKTDKDWVRKLKEFGKGIICDNDSAHRSEHSIEFQLIFLQHLFGSDFSLLPILCGSFHKVLEEVSRPSEIPGMDTFFAALRLTLTEYAADTLLIAGVDFSHIGPKFGHRQSAPSMLLETKNHDILLIDAVCRGDVEGFWAESRKVKGIYNVCGFSAIACFLEVLGGVRGHLLDYDIWHEESQRSAVSFAAIAFKGDQPETSKE